MKDFTLEEVKRVYIQEWMTPGIAIILGLLLKSLL